MKAPSLQILPPGLLVVIIDHLSKVEPDLKNFRPFYYYTEKQVISRSLRRQDRSSNLYATQLDVEKVEKAFENVEIVSFTEHFEDIKDAIMQGHARQIS